MRTSPPDPGRRPVRLDVVATGRLHLSAALLFLTYGTVQLAGSDLTVADLLLALPYLAMGGFTLCLVGTGRMLLANAAGRRPAGQPGPALAASMLIALGALGAGAPGAAPGQAASAAVWGVGLLFHVALFLATVRRAPNELPLVGPGRRRLFPPTLVSASVAYAALAALAVPLAYAGYTPLLAAMHLLLAGLLATTILCVGSRLLTHATGRPPPRALLFLVVLGAAPGPALLALGLHVGSTPWFQIGATLEATALLLFALWGLAGLAWNGLGRFPSLAYASSLAAILAGATLGVHFAFMPGTRSLGAVHALLNLYGFAGLFILGASTHMYAPALLAGLRPLKVHFFTTLGLNVAGIALAVVFLKDRPGLAAAGLVLIAASYGLHFAGSIAADVRARRALRPPLAPATRAPAAATGSPP